MIHKRDNRGFSLVELIIVIAIMAILIGVLAPAYLRYVEKARKSSDADAIAACLNAIETVVLDPQYAEKIDANTRITLYIKKDNNDAILEFDAKRWDDTDVTKIIFYDDIANALNSIIGRYALKSRDWIANTKYINNMGKYSMEFLYAEVTENGRIEYTLEDFDGADTKLADYSPVLKSKIDGSVR